MKRMATGIAVAGLVGAATAAAEIAPGDVTIVDLEIAQPLTGEPGDPERGRGLVAARKLGNCLACHKNSDMDARPFHGEIGPPLDGAGSRWTEGQLRAIVVNSKAIFGDQTMMPAFYRTRGFTRPLADFEGRTILTAQQVEDVIAYLRTLTDE